MGTEIESWLPGAGLRGGLTCKPRDLGACGTVLYLDCDGGGHKCDYIC